MIPEASSDQDAAVFHHLINKAQPLHNVHGFYIVRHHTGFDPVDMPDQLVDLFIRLCGQNGGRLSTKKRKDHFSFLSDEELTRMESIVQEGYRFDPSL